MRIFYDHQAFSLQNAGGITRYFYELMKYFSTVPDLQTELLLGMSGTVYPLRQLNPAKAKVTGFPEWLPKGSARYVANEIWGNLVAPFRGRMDIYHPTNYLRMPTVRTRAVVFTHHDCTHERYPQLFPDAKKIFWARRNILATADAIICVSESSRRDLLAFYNIDASKTRLVHHGLTPLQRTAQAAEELRKTVRREYIVYVGMRASFKNFDGLLRALHATKLADSMDLLVLGGGELNANETDLIRKLNLQHAIHSLPKVSDSLLAEAYAGAKLFVYPSLSEGFGFPPLEAMALDCPVLASRTSSIPEISQDAPFYFDPADEETFSRELLRAINDLPARERAVKRGREVAAQYSWTKCAERTLTIYRDCA